MILSIEALIKSESPSPYDLYCVGGTLSLNQDWGRPDHGVRAVQCAVDVIIYNIYRPNRKYPC